MEKKLIRKNEQKPDRPDLSDAELERVAGGTLKGLVCFHCKKTFPDTPEGAQELREHMPNCPQKPQGI